MHKTKILPITFVAILIIGIIFIQYRIIKIGSKDVSEVGIVKSSLINTLDTLPAFDTDKINIIPQKNSLYKKENIWAKNYILLDAITYYPLAEKNSHDSVPIASTTKIMTATIVIENYKLKDIVTISPNAAAQIGSDVMLRSGERLTVESLLYALLVQSGNDAAMALAENYPVGGLDGFVNTMNAKAKYLGMDDTKYLDPAGLDDAGRSSAFDLAIITSYMIKNPIFSKIVKTSEITISSIDGKFSHKLDNSNRLIKGDELLYYPNAIGVKTGFTPEAGHCLVSAAEKNGKKIVSVVLNTIESTNDASAKESKKLLEWGFTNYNY
ncbi:MAG: hypothetical protein ACD_58C00123G0007 [uncultured bacterium]|nr:MAG: hypothetical protein ACD_58C00123G0007 [uncultured bacterium]